MKDNLVVLQVVLPLVAAVICSMLRGRIIVVQTFACAAVGISFLMSAILFVQVYAGDPIMYKVGGWHMQYGIELRVDLLSATMLLLVGFIGIMSTIYGIYPSRREVDAVTLPKFYAAFLLAFAGQLGIIVSNDAFNVYVFLEVTSLSVYVLVAISRTRCAVVSAFEYLIVGSIGATFYLVGVGFLYAHTGTLNMAGIFDILQSTAIDRSVYAGVLFVVLGLVIKAALFPFHGWLIKAYYESPSFVVAFLSGTATKVMIYLVIRAVHSIFGADLIFSSMPFGDIMLLASAAAMVWASIFAVMSKDIKDVLAYSSVANIGCIVFAVCINTHASTAAAMAYMVHHSIVKSALFMVSGGISYHFGRHELGQCISLNRVMPSITAACILLSLSLVGLPATLGFVAKWHMLSSFAEANSWMGVSTLCISSVCSVIYTLKIIECMYHAAHKEVGACANDIEIKTPRAMTACIWIMVFFGVAAGAYPIPLTSVSEQIAADLLHSS